MYIFIIGQQVKINKPNHARHGQIGEILYHFVYVGGRVTEIVVFEKFPDGQYIACEFEQKEIEAVK